LFKIACVFPGQGSQYVGMGQELCNSFPELLSYFQEAEATLGIDLRGLCFSGPEEKLKSTSNTQPALLTISMICYEALRKSGVTPHCLAGHSLGEYSALVAAGSISFSEALLLVRQRGLLMEEAYPVGAGGMAAVLGLEANTVEEVCREVAEVGFVQIANFNCPGQLVISGEKNALVRIIELLKKAGAKKVIELNVSGPFHSQLMRKASSKFASYLDKTGILEPSLPVIANVNAAYLTTSPEIRKSLAAQIYSPVLWEESVRKLYADGIRVFIEVGPGKVLSGLIKKTVKDATILNVEDRASLENTLTKLRKCM